MIITFGKACLTICNNDECKEADDASWAGGLVHQLRDNIMSAITC